jgi:hypothetical protein
MVRVRPRRHKPLIILVGGFPIEGMRSIHFEGRIWFCDLST